MNIQEKELVMEALEFCKTGEFKKDRIPEEIIKSLFLLNSEKCITAALVADRHFDGHHNINYENGTRDFYDNNSIATAVNRAYDWNMVKCYECTGYYFAGDDLDSITVILQTPACDNEDGYIEVEM